MKTIYTVNITTKTESTPISPEFSTIEEARTFFENEKTKLIGSSVDVSEWQDNDQSWGDVYSIEIIKISFDDDNDIENMETVFQTEYYSK